MAKAQVNTEAAAIDIVMINTDLDYPLPTGAYLVAEVAEDVAAEEPSKNRRLCVVITRYSLSQIRLNSSVTDFVVGKCTSL